MEMKVLSRNVHSDLTHWKGLSALLLSLPRPPCLLAQPLQEQGNTGVLGTLLYQLLGP